MHEEFTEMTALLAVESAIADAINGDVKRGNGTVRDRCDQMLVDMYQATGGKSYDLRVNGEKVGTYSVTVKKAQQSRSVSVEDMGEFIEWALENGCFETMFKPNLNAAKDWLDATGEVPAGCGVYVSEDPEIVSGTTLRISKDFKREVRQRLDENVLGGARFAALLNGGE